MECYFKLSNFEIGSRSPHYKHHNQYVIQSLLAVGFGFVVTTEFKK